MATQTIDPTTRSASGTRRASAVTPIAIVLLGALLVGVLAVVAGGLIATAPTDVTRSTIDTISAPALTQHRHDEIGASAGEPVDALREQRRGEIGQP